ncbi:hypothetical protein GOP47_0020766 [Adiantum capillus-veneris]|uniref:Clathrin light chain n=1 Tax=Adiantum capillus-veneris TaxID=13818 RepID=A0A9D4UBN8_ADICA|nr:hypothetical protein GOP47_0020766 [Adiantum capillus-veneris]
MASFDAYAGGGDDLGNDTRPFESDGYMGFDPRLPSQRFDSFRMPEDSYADDHYTQEDSKELGDLDEEDEFGTHKERTGSNGAFDPMPGGTSPPPPYHSSFDDELGDGRSPSMSSSNFGQSFDSRLQGDFAPADEFSQTMDSNGKGLDHDDTFAHGEGFGYGFPPPTGFHDGGAVLPPPDEMQAEEGFMLREWKRKNAIHLEEKVRNEREKLSQIIDAADVYKEGFLEKRKAHCEATKKNNRDKEKVFLENHKDFHANANKHYWKAVAELIPHELPSMELKSRGKKDQKKPAVVNHGPKPGKATDLTRMRQVLVKLKHNPPAHMILPPPAPPAVAGAEGGDGKANAGGGDGKATASAPVPSPPPAPLQKQGSIPTAAVA